jgi:acrylyl-CoA reductase (NADPH)
VAWQRLARDLDRAKLDATRTDIKLADVPATAQAIIDGRVRGRMVVNIQE